MSIHPLQSPAWTEFRRRTGVKTIRIKNYRLTVHPLPKLPYTIIYFPKGPAPDEKMLDSLKELGQKERAILIKLEPNARYNQELEKFLLAHGCGKGRPLFTKYTFQLDLNKSENELLAGMKSKTRYNIRLAQRRGVKVEEDDSEKAFETYLKLTTETTQRQGFFAHTPTYHRQMWQTMRQAKIAHLFKASLGNQILATYIFFVYDGILYYPYGASTREHREVMAPYLIFWEAIKFGKKLGCQIFDMWGSLGPNPDTKNPWYGFHRFKEGFGGQLVEFIGTYDLVINSVLYPLYNFANTLRWIFLRLKSSI